ncbi:RNA-dependent RNA polymerase 1 [Trichonephila clavipes]|nr:RNA-dependent RNA polymerase 1 [Trichonephila clavipes]
MNELNFRIVHLPKKKLLTIEEIKTEIEQYKEKYKSYIKTCGLKNVLVQFLTVKNLENVDPPEIEELVLQIQAEYYPNDSSSETSDYYKEFCKKWKRLFHHSSSPILVLYEKNSFLSIHRPRDIAIKCSEISIGVLSFDGIFYEYEVFPFKNKINFYHDIYEVMILFLDLKLQFSYNNIRNIFVNIDSDPYEVFFDLCNPPLIFWQERCSNHSNFIDHRTAEIITNDDIDVFGRSNILKLSFQKPSKAEQIISQIHFQCNEKPIHYVNFETLYEQTPEVRELKLSHFGCTYLMTAMFKRNFTLAAQATNLSTCLDEIKELCQENEDCLEKALVLVLAAIDSGKIVNYWHEIERQFHYYMSKKDEINYRHYVVPEKCRLIRRVTLTPTRQLLWAPEIMFENRFLRNFDSEYALRVSFRDDNYSRLSFLAANADENVFDFSIRNPMLKGIQIEDRLYEFLAWSNSQIRDHGIWMYACDQNGKTVRDIRAWMGDFSHIHSVPKYMARMGQCFSQTEDAISVPLDPKYVKTEKDIVCFNRRNGTSYCFSDGVGKISLTLAKKVRDALGHNKSCSVFQVRYEGYKGILTIDPTLKEPDIVFRKSMKKFNSPQNIRLEIARTSAPEEPMTMSNNARSSHCETMPDPYFMPTMAGAYFKLLGVRLPSVFLGGVQKSEIEFQKFP